ncbi:MAG: helix-turn-helix domain-containing protein [Bacteroidota bacterium]
MTTHDNFEPASVAAMFINQTNKHVFLTGKAGTGKTTFLKRIVEITHKKAVVVAPTGIAAINAGGVTMHSLFQLPFGCFVPSNSVTQEQHQNIRINNPSSLMKNLQMRDNKRSLLRQIELVIIDEVSMLRADLLDAVDTLLRHVRRKYNLPFGGLQMLFIGDLLQLPPVTKDDEWQVLKEFYKSMYFFDARVLQEDKPVYVELGKVYRQSDERFLKVLNNLRENKVSKEDVELLNNYYKPFFQAPETEKYITLTTHNYKAISLNEEFLKEIKTPSSFYDATISGEFSEYSYPIDNRLELKLGAQVMFIKNDPSGEHKFFNGKIGVVDSLGTDYITVKCEEDTPIFVEKYTWENLRFELNEETNEIEEKTIGTFTHFPLKLAWAITVHKSQGLTFDRAIIDIGAAFAPGQVYVALSRLRSLDGLVLTSKINYESIRPDVIVLDYSANESKQTNLLELAKQESTKYIRNYILNSFDIDALTKFLAFHVDSYSKDEKRSIKQTHLEWAIKLKENLNEIKPTYDKFLTQIVKITEQDYTLDFILQRVIAARDYFKPQLINIISNIIDQKELVSKEKKTKQYLKELSRLEVSFQEQLKQMYKAAALIEANIKGTSLTRETQNKLSTEIEIPKSEKVQVEKISKEKKPKLEKGSTQKDSYKLYKEGISVKEIAALRGLTQQTIENHLATFIQSGELNPEELVSKEKLNKIIDTSKQLNTLAAIPIKEALPADYTYSDIRFARAYMEKLKLITV